MSLHKSWFHLYERYGDLIKQASYYRKNDTGIAVGDDPCAIVYQYYAYRRLRAKLGILGHDHIEGTTITINKDGHSKKDYYLRDKVRKYAKDLKRHDVKKSI